MLFRLKSQNLAVAAAIPPMAQCPGRAASPRSLVLRRPSTHANQQKPQRPARPALIPPTFPSLVRDVVDRPELRHPERVASNRTAFQSPAHVVAKQPTIPSL